MNGSTAVEALTVTLGAFSLRKIDFAVAPEEVLVILGPNGSGKSVTLETIAGFHRPDFGRVLIGGRDVTALPPERRKLGFVVQNFGLFPHLSVAQNIAIAHRHEPPGVTRETALPPRGDPAALLDYFGLAHLAQRKPPDLSPGEKQRVALARALASAPDLFLFDEPFAALDTQTREHLRDELKSFLSSLSIPAILVTHDHIDAITLADKIVVLRDGRIMQSGPAAEILEKPASAFVAHFVGVENVLAGRVAEISDARITVRVGEQTLRAPIPVVSVTAGSAAFLSIRAEHVSVFPPSDARAAQPEVNCFEAHITGLRAVGPLVTVNVDCGFPLKAYLLAPQARSMNLKAGDAVDVRIAADAIHVMAN